MPELFLELFSEEIPAGMQARAAADLARLVGEALAPLAPEAVRTFHGPRRIALSALVQPGVAEARETERGPRRTAPEQALAGFLRKHTASREQLRDEGDFWVLDRVRPGVAAAALVAEALPGLLRRFPWPKSMRWGGTSTFTWVRPLRRIICILDGVVVPLTLAEGSDDGHDLVAANLSEGHRFLSPGSFVVTGCVQWRDELRRRHVVVDAGARRAAIADGLTTLAAAQNWTVVEDAGLLDEVAGLVEWPVPLLGRIDAVFMDLPPEVMQVSMRVNQRYFALRDPGGQPAPGFGFAANIETADAGAAIIAGNERVLRARFSDARYFWDRDRARRLDSRVAALDAVTFHAELGSQGDRVRRLVALATMLAQVAGADPAQAARAALLAKADLTTGMVGQVPELQGIMGGYYAAHDDEHPAVAAALREHYAPRGPTDPVPSEPVAVTVALADRLDLLAGFFAIGEKPTGAGDPYALRRAALGVIRLLRSNALRVKLREAVAQALGQFKQQLAGRDPVPLVDEITAFITERLRIQLRSEGARHDVLTAVLGSGEDDDLVRLLARSAAVAELLGTEDGANLLAAYRRAANILRIERKDGPHDRPVEAERLEQAEETALAEAFDQVVPAVASRLDDEDFTDAMASLAGLRTPLDAFFDKVTVNVADRPEIRRNRLALLHRIRAAMNTVADFQRIEG